MSKYDQEGKKCRDSFFSFPDQIYHVIVIWDHVIVIWDHVLVIWDRALLLHGMCPTCQQKLMEKI